MKIIHKMSYALWVYDNTCSSSTRIGFYKIVGSDLKELLLNVMTFNKQMAGKVEVQPPMPWGQARQHTWNEIVANGFNEDPNAFEHCGPDGSSMSDDDVSNYWNYVGGTNSAEQSSKQSKEDFLAHLDELSSPASKFSNAVYELAELVVSMHPEKEKEDLWIGLNFIRCANEVVRVLQAMPAALNQLGPAATVEFPLNNGPTIRGAVVAGFIGQSACRLVVCPNGEVWSVEARGGTRLNLTVSDPYGTGLKHEGTIDPDCGRWVAIPTALEVLHSIARGPLKRALTANANAKVEQAIVVAAGGPDALELATAAAN